MSAPTQIQPRCAFCPHAVHPPGVRCNAPDPVKPCKCKGKPGFWSQLGSGLGNAIGEALFGGGGN